MHERQHIAKQKITNHASVSLNTGLGNVLVTISDKRLPQCSATVVTGHTAYVISATDYSAFGAPLPGRTFAGEGYMYGFQGQLMDDEIKGSGNSYAFEYRIHDSRLGRFLSVDPLEKEYPWNSPYAFAENRVIDGKDLEGKEWSSVKEGTLTTSTVKIKVVNNSNVLNDTKILLATIKPSVEAIFNKDFGDKQFKVSIEFEIVDPKDATGFVINLVDATKDSKGNYVAGNTKTLGNTQENVMTIAVSVDGIPIAPNAADGVARTVGHELGHTSNLDHPWDPRAIPFEIDQEEAQTPDQRKTIRSNLMNSAENPDPSLRSDSGKEVTKGQLNVIDKTVESQQEKKP